jgi:hypothetical protein
MKKEKNIFAVPSLILSLLAITTLLSRSWFGWKLEIAFNVVGIISSMIGTIWIAGGVVLSQSEKAQLTKVKKTHKNLLFISSLMDYASRTVYMGIAYIFAGGAFQVLAVII